MDGFGMLLAGIMVVYGIVMGIAMLAREPRKQTGNEAAFILVGLFMVGFGIYFFLTFAGRIL